MCQHAEPVPRELGGLTRGAGLATLRARLARSTHADPGDTQTPTREALMNPPSTSAADCRSGSSRSTPQVPSTALRPSRAVRAGITATIATLGVTGLMACGASLLPPVTSAAATSHGTKGHARTERSRVHHKRTHHARTRAQATSSPSVVTTMARWHLPNPISRAGAAALPGGRVLLLGGLFASGGSSADVAVLDTANGRLTTAATLPSPTHDAGSATLNGRAFLFGGGQSTPFTLVQGVTLPGSGPGATATATTTGQLPQARADDEAVTIGGTAFVVGGYNGYNGDAPVLETTNGTTFSTLVTLPVAVRYPAVAASNGNIYVFGGENEPGGTTQEYSTPTGSTTPPPGQQVAVVQQINIRTRTAKVIGSLPHAVQGAAAFVLGGHIFLAGGDSYAPGTPASSGSTIWSFDPATVSFSVAGHLAAPVSYSAVAVEGHAAWLIGGERDGSQVASAQRVALRSSR